MERRDIRDIEQQMTYSYTIGQISQALSVGLNSLKYYLPRIHLHVIDHDRKGLQQ